MEKQYLLLEVERSLSTPTPLPHHTLILSAVQHWIVPSTEITLSALTADLPQRIFLCPAFA